MSTFYVGYVIVRCSQPGKNGLLLVLLYSVQKPLKSVGHNTIQVCMSTKVQWFVNYK